MTWSDLDWNIADSMHYQNRNRYRAEALALHHQPEATMPDKSIKLIQQGNEWLIERNGQSPEKLGADPGVARSQIMQFLDELVPHQPAGAPAEPHQPAEDHETTPTTHAKHKKAA